MGFLWICTQIFQCIYNVSGFDTIDSNNKDYKKYINYDGIGSDYKYNQGNKPPNINMDDNNNIRNKPQNDNNNYVINNNVEGNIVKQYNYNKNEMDNNNNIYLNEYNMNISHDKYNNIKYDNY